MTAVWLIIYQIDEYLQLKLSINLELHKSYELFIVEEHYISQIYNSDYYTISAHLSKLLILSMPFLLILYSVTSVVWLVIILFLLLLDVTILDYYSEYPLDSNYWKIFNLFFKNTIIILIFLAFMTYVNIEFIVNNSGALLILEPVNFLMAHKDYSYFDALRVFNKVYNEIPNYFYCRKIIK